MVLFTLAQSRYSTDDEHEQCAPAPAAHVLRAPLHHDTEEHSQEAR